MNLAFIKVRFKHEELSSPWGVDGNSKLSVLKQYFPQATGLTYTKNSKTRGLLIESDEGVINREIDSYGVHISQDLKSSIPCRKRKLVQQMINEIRGSQNAGANKTGMSKMKA